MKILKKIVTINITIILILGIYIIYEITSSKKQYFINEKNINIPIFTYHDIVINKEEIEQDYMQTTLSNFEKQINGFLKLGYTPITYKELVEYKEGKTSISKRSFIITFDDGYENVYKYAYPIIKKYNVPITIFVVDNLIGTENYFSWDEAREMQESGLVNICSHGLRHIDYSQKTSNVLVEETNEAYKNIKENITNDDIKIFAYPYGTYTDEETEELGENGYIQNLMDGKINKSKNLNLNQLHRMYPLNDSVVKIIIKEIYKTIKY